MSLISNKFLVLASSIVVLTANAQTHEFAQPARHEPATTEGAGWANLSHPQGRYIFGVERDSRSKTPTILFGRPERQDFQFFSWEEEQALWLLLQEKIAKDAPEMKVAFGKVHAQRNLKWPRVVVKAGEVCVPRLEHSDDDDWQDHLTCVTVELK